MAIKPINSRILVKRAENEKTSPGGIILPENNKEGLGMGEVIAKGPEVTAEISVGDTIFFGKFAGQDVEHEGQKLLMIKESDALAVINK